MLDPDIQRLLDTVFNVAPAPGAPDVALLRAAAEQAPQVLGGDPIALASVANAQVPGADPPLAVRIYRPATATPAPVVVYAHGGGWVTGSLDSHDRLCRRLAQRMRLISPTRTSIARSATHPKALSFTAASRMRPLGGA